MNLEQIKSLVSVVNNKSFSQAAKAMYVSQPTISMHIKTLENELGEQLLIRSTKDVVLSEAGKTFYPYAVRMLKAEEEALYLMKNKEKEVTGEVLVASSSVPARYLIPGFLAYSKKKQPGIRYKISEGDSTEVIQGIMRFEHEIGIGSICPANLKCTATPLLSDKIVLITPNTKKYRAYHGVMESNDLKKEEFVVRENGSGTKVSEGSLEKRLGLSADKMKIAAEVNSTETVKRVVSEGVGVAFVSGLAVRDYAELKRLLVFEFPEALTVRTLYLLQHVERNLSRTAECAVELLKDYCSGITDGDGRML